MLPIFGRIQSGCSRRKNLWHCVLPSVLFWAGNNDQTMETHLHFSSNTASLHLLFYLVEHGNRLKVKVTTQEFLCRPIKLQNKDHVQYKLKELIKGSTHLNTLIKQRPSLLTGQNASIHQFQKLPEMQQRMSILTILSSTQESWLKGVSLI